MPRPRLTVRTLMVAVAVVVVLIGPPVVLIRQAARFDRLAGYHLNRLVTYEGQRPSRSPSKVSANLKMADHHYALYVKYARAARSPWWPVDPDPPPPSE